MNAMLEPRIDKVVVHIGVGESGQRLVNAETILTQITKQTPVRSLAKKTLPNFGIKKREPIGIKLTLRGKTAEEFLQTAFKAAGNVIKQTQFDQSGNFAFGIEEHTDFPGMKYEPDIGIFGMDVAVSLKRPGYRISRRRVARRKLPSVQRIDRDEALAYVQKTFGVQIVEAA
ncbi:MAG: 50S ribosomal protein L5 [Methanosaeta sp. PtaB.Bin039]|nr:MAG: 50S ribosomal protein L5 [Methanosaeta sp. PtaB.Bin039]HOT07485.1 50S ribosomal protein L5 [Methanotrichaceae archaeon]HQF16990.1 50S ribosomal protein L5 [Methanotrichaceae archaeon]HQI91610.1 50S ribosomal protein L5 [Methanotrichaceae archaeon]HQJ28896.1 50S ribosomal protein L5 [Methanotrichaceae archaeon]